MRNFIKQRTVELWRTLKVPGRGQSGVHFRRLPADQRRGIHPGDRRRLPGDLVPADKLCTREPEMGSEDFALVTQMVPATFLYLGAEGGLGPRAAATTPMSCSTRTASTWVLLL